MIENLSDQSLAVQRAAVNLRGHAQNLSGLAGRGKRPQHEADEAARWLPHLEAAARTMVWLEANQDAMRRAVAA